MDKPKKQQPHEYLEANTDPDAIEQHMKAFKELCDKPKVTKPIIDIYPTIEKIVFEMNCSKGIVDTFDNNILLACEDTAKFGANHAAKQIIDWMGKHIVTREVDTGDSIFNEPLIEYKCLNPEDWQSLLNLVKEK